MDLNIRNEAIRCDYLTINTLEYKDLCLTPSQAQVYLK